MAKTVDRHLVLCPGFMNDRGLWTRMESGLADLSRCHFADLGQDASLADIARRVLADAPAKFVLIGFSMGGYVAREVVEQAPLRVAGLVLMNTSARPYGANKVARNRGIIDVTKERGFRGLSQTALRNTLHPDRRHDDSLLQVMRDMALRMGETAFLRQLALERRDGRPNLKDIECPTLVVWSRQDRLRSLDEARELTSGIANARLAIIENCGHMTPLEQPDELLQILRNWLADAGL
jgi:pimeloyl-ACP methyl ester carboxylesterase